MPFLGVFAILKFFFRIFSAMFRKPESRGLLWVAFLTIGLGMWFYHQYEPTITNWVDAYYFTVITLATIGYGDFSPTTPLTKIFTTFYVFVGLGIITGLIGLVGETAIEDTNRRQAERNAKKEQAEK
jgi:voltage-gated potassium channel Kch